jgi:hypothetical protein
MSDVSEDQIEKLYNIAANTGIVIEQTINGLLRVFADEHHPYAQSYATGDKLIVLRGCGITDVIIAAAVQANVTQMAMNVDILTT